MRLPGKVAVVTGSGSGLGEAMVLRMAKEGASVVVNDIKVDRMNDVVGKIVKAGGKAIGCEADVSKRSEADELMKTAMAQFGHIDILVNNAAIPGRGTFFELTDESWDTILAVDLKSVFNCIYAVGHHMMERRYGKVINISSAGGTGASSHGGGNAAHYSAAKAGVIQLTKSAARELGPYGINVNAVAPGSFLTPMTHIGRSKELIEEHIESRRKLTVLNRVGNPEDLANLALFLASDESSFISGQLICCDGGRTDRM